MDKTFWHGITVYACTVVETSVVTGFWQKPVRMQREQTRVPISVPPDVDFAEVKGANAS